VSAQKATAAGARPQWLRSLRRAKQELAAAMRISDHALFVVESFLGGRECFVAPTAPLLRVPRGLDLAQARLGRAARRLDQSLELSALDPRNAAEAGLLIFAARQQWLETAMFLTLVTAETYSTLALMFDVNPGPGTPGLRVTESSIEFVFVDPSDLDRLRSCLLPDSAAERDRLRLLRRRRSAPLRMEDAPRQISRGRAPPLESTCQL
jgi:hypothetical protein